MDRGPGVDDRRRTEGHLRRSGGVAAGAPGAAAGDHDVGEAGRVRPRGRRQAIVGDTVREVLPSEAGALLRLLEAPETGKQRVTDLDRLRKGVFRSSSKGMVAALQRTAELTEFGAAKVDVSAVPPRRLLILAQHGLAGKAAQLRRMDRGIGLRCWWPR